MLIIVVTFIETIAIGWFTVKGLLRSKELKIAVGRSDFVEATSDGKRLKPNA